MCALNVAIASQLIYLSDNRVSRAHRSSRYIELFPLCWNCCLHTPSRYLFNFFGVRSVMIAQITINMQVSKGVSAHTSTKHIGLSQRSTTAIAFPTHARRQLCKFTRLQVARTILYVICISRFTFYRRIHFKFASVPSVLRSTQNHNSVVSSVANYRSSKAAFNRNRHDRRFVKIACDRQSHY